MASSSCFLGQDTGRHESRSVQRAQKHDFLDHQANAEVVLWHTLNGAKAGGCSLSIDQCRFRCFQLFTALKRREFSRSGIIRTIPKNSNTTGFCTFNFDGTAIFSKPIYSGFALQSVLQQACTAQSCPMFFLRLLSFLSLRHVLAAPIFQRLENQRVI